MMERLCDQAPRTCPGLLERPSLSLLTMLERLCDQAVCRKPLHTPLKRAKCKGVACSKNCQVCPLPKR